LLSPGFLGNLRCHRGQAATYISYIMPGSRVINALTGKSDPRKNKFPKAFHELGMGLA
jgi:hypothetical protein